LPAHEVAQSYPGLRNLLLIALESLAAFHSIRGRGRFGITIAWLQSREVHKAQSERSTEWPTPKDKFKDRIDATGDKAKPMTDRGADKSKETAKRAGQSAKDVGQKIKEQGK